MYTIVIQQWKKYSLYEVIFYFGITIVFISNYNNKYIKKTKRCFFFHVLKLVVLFQVSDFIFERDTQCVRNGQMFLLVV